MKNIVIFALIAGTFAMPAMADQGSVGDMVKAIAAQRAELKKHVADTPKNQVIRELAEARMAAANAFRSLNGSSALFYQLKSAGYLTFTPQVSPAMPPEIGRVTIFKMPVFGNVNAGRQATFLVVAESVSGHQAIASFTGLELVGEAFVCNPVDDSLRYAMNGCVYAEELPLRPSQSTEHFDTATHVLRGE